MRVLARLSARADAAYDHAYHHKLRGRIWRALEGTDFDEQHESGEPPGFVYSNIFPWGEMQEGDERNLLVASPHESLLANVAEDFQADRELNVGEMPLWIDEVSALDVDVGEPGTSGTIETGTGVFVRLYEHHREKFGIEDGHGDSPTFWRPEHSIEPFTAAIEDNAQQKHDLFAPDYLPGPTEVEGPLFDGYELLKTYALPLTVTQGVEREVVLSKWRFDYTVRDDDHRRHLNLLLDCGVGGRNGLGLGFVNITNE
ncbi:CRISPR-associated protein Cas6 (plasmid) [Halalkaliarchaeum sp. AArc-CO]|uniref:CRISPR-associated endoribonuclease Cas6 n=1 Tax=Halalkaliarchaeum sp. AArc-CO TaxID=2866381 RepID=UPI00217F161B|nr:CRISPR-associated endoribonuclease Cas6 [Halalkaliarchaeum sp. AArc-CO]UWG49289.1 CRISPR-associated protein Cas6 [Halalkaliarchaeum sp. AArc-CO]